MGRIWLDTGGIVSHNPIRQSLPPQIVTCIGRLFSRRDQLSLAPEALWEGFGLILWEQFPIILFANLHGPLVPERHQGKNLVEN